MRLRIDPWDPEYGASAEFEPALGPPPGIQLEIETSGRWRPIPAAPRGGLPCCAFIDGVRRIDARLFAEDADTQAAGLAGSWAVGCAWSTRPPCIGDVRVGRELVVGGGLAAAPLDTEIGGRMLTYRPSSVAGITPLDPIQGLQNAMREAEADLARATLERGAADLVVSDGPLTYFLQGPAVGMVKRQSRSYLDPARANVLTELRPGERTPIFKLGEQRLERYTWYLRLADQRAIDGTMAGIVRLEVAAPGGLEATISLADLAGAVLPHFATPPG